MPQYAIDFYSGYLEEVLSTVGSRDVTLVERYLRLGEHTQMVLGLPNYMMEGWREAMEALLMEPSARVETLAQAVAMASLLRDAGQRRFRMFTDSPDIPVLTDVLGHLGHADWATDLVDSAVGQMKGVDHRLRWGFLDVNQVEELLFTIFGNDSFKVAKTAAIAGRLSDYARQDAEKELLEVGIETQNSVSHNIDYLIIGSKGTGGTKHDKVKDLQDGGHRITVLDEDGFEALIHSPHPPREDWEEDTAIVFEQFVSALRHVWAFELDIYTLVYEYDPSTNVLED